MKRTIKVEINGSELTVEIEPDELLLDLLRKKLRLLGVKEGCRKGECGACTVLIDGEASYSCQVPAAQVDGASITTIEGIGSEGGDLHPLQKAFLKRSAVRCGFCTPGIILSSLAFLREHPNPTERDLIELFSSHLCPCGTYQLWKESIEEYLKNQQEENSEKKQSIPQ